MLIYRITCLINHKEYIGQTAKTLEKKWKGYPEGNDRLINRAIREHGKENFVIEQIDSSQSQEEINLKEILWIEYFNSHVSLGKGYNVEWGGNDRGSVSQGTRELLSRLGKGRPAWNKGLPATDEHKENNRKAQMGHSRNKGISLTEEQRRNRSKLNKDQVLAIRSSKLKTAELAAIYNVTGGTIRNVKLRKCWGFI